MAQQFRIPNFPDINLQDRTNLTEDAASGQNTIAVIGVKGMSEDDIALVGSPGSLASEIQTIASITDLEITLDDDLINDHRQGEPFTVLFGDQIKAYRVLAMGDYPPADSVFLLNALDSPIDIDYDSPDTLFSDPTGNENYWYKFVFYNSVTQAETNIASSVPMRGGISHYCSIEDVRREAGMMNENQIATTQVATRRDQSESEVNGTLLAAGYVLPLKDQQRKLYTPPTIANIVRLLAAGYLLTQDYGVVSEGDSKDGKSKLAMAHDLLEKLQNHEMILIDIAGRQMATTPRVRGWPDDTTAVMGSNDPNLGEPAMFSMDKKF